nr:CD209 antigen-like protein E isoform X3 [Pogona vitticeps]
MARLKHQEEEKGNSSNPKKPDKKEKDTSNPKKPDKKVKDSSNPKKPDKKEKVNKDKETSKRNAGTSTLTSVTLVLFILATMMFFMYLEVIELSQNLSNRLAYWTEKNRILQEEIDKVTELLEEWVPYKKNFYYFSEEEADWEHSIEECIEKDSELISIIYGEEEAFIDQETARLGYGYWIGLQKNRSAPHGLLWINNEEVRRPYWNIDAKQPNIDGDCIYVVPKCRIKKCWHDDLCNRERRFICKKVARPVDSFR